MVESPRQFSKRVISSDTLSGSLRSSCARSEGYRSATPADALTSAGTPRQSASWTARPYASYLAGWINRSHAAKHGRHVSAEPEEPHPVLGKLTGGARLPRLEFRADPHDDEIHIPLSARAERLPRAKHRVERLSAITKRPSEERQRPIGRKGERATGGATFGSLHTPERQRIGAVVSHEGATARDTQPRDILDSAVAVADDESRATERLTLVGEIPMPTPIRAQAVAKSCRRWIERRVHVVHPVEIAEIGVATVGERSQCWRTQTLVHALCGRAEHRLPERVHAERAGRRRARGRRAEPRAQATPGG